MTDDDPEGVTMSEILDRNLAEAQDAIFLEEMGARIKLFRAARNVTQLQLADVTGLTRTSISNVEAGRQNTRILTITQIAAELGTTVSTLIGESISGNDMTAIEQRATFLRAVEASQHILARAAEGYARQMQHDIRRIMRALADPDFTTL